MKRLLISAFAILVAYTAFAQDDDLDSLFYVRPAFTHGIVYMQDGGIQQGNINICNIDQSIRFIDPAGDTLVMEGCEAAVKVTLDKITYYRFRDCFTEMVDFNGTTALGVQRQTVQIENSKAGGFTSSATSSVESYGVDAMTGLYYKHIEMIPENWKYTCRYVLYDTANNKFYTATKKNFLKMFPAKKDIIEAFCGKDKAALDDPERVKELFNKMK